MSYNKKHTLKQNIGFQYEDFVLEQVKNDYDEA